MLDSNQAFRIGKKRGPSVPRRTAAVAGMPTPLSGMIETLASVGNISRRLIQRKGHESAPR